jgi:hypothetical protein
MLSFWIEVLTLVVCICASPVSAEPPPTCPEGSGPRQVFELAKAPHAGPPRLRWTCQEGLIWPLGYNLKDSDCPKGTHLVSSRELICLPPAPECGPRSAALADPYSRSGWDCVAQPGCPSGTKAEFNPVHGWVCKPLQGNNCPAGTEWAGLAGGGCVPVGER